MEIGEGVDMSSMAIIELCALSREQVAELQLLMRELAPDIMVSAEKLNNAAQAAGTHLFVAIGQDGHIVGCASLCELESPTGRKASVEDVVVLNDYRGRGISRALMEHVIAYASRELKDVELHLTSHPSRVAANALYRSLGFEKRDTNFYRMRIRENDN